MSKPAYKLVNAITIYRIIVSPVLLILIFNKEPDIFKWLLAISFFTDLVDGYLARKFKVVSILGSRLDSIGDDLTIFAAVIGMFVFKPEFIHQELTVLIILFCLFVIQNTIALIRYKKFTSFHVYSAKIAAIFQGVFLILIFLLPQPIYPLFYIAAVITAIDLLEEIILVLLLPKWEVNVKGLYWVLKKRK